MSIAELVERYGTVAKFARDLSRLAGEEVSWERVYNWTGRNTVPKNMVLPVHRLIGAPLDDLLR
jgi:hypothetical protein